MIVTYPYIVFLHVLHKVHSNITLETDMTYTHYINDIEIMQQCINIG